MSEKKTEETKVNPEEQKKRKEEISKRITELKEELSFEFAIGMVVTTGKNIPLLDIELK